MCCCIFEQTKKGVKRKADTTTPYSVVTPSVPFDPPYEATPTIKSADASLQRREGSARQIKKPKKDLLEDDDESSVLPLPHHQQRKDSKGEPLSEQLRYCQGIIRELFTKKHAVCYH